VWKSNLARILIIRLLFFKVYAFFINVLLLFFNNYFQKLCFVVNLPCHVSFGRKQFKSQKREITIETRNPDARVVLCVICPVD